MYKIAIKLVGDCEWVVTHYYCLSKEETLAKFREECSRDDFIWNDPAHFSIKGGSCPTKREEKSTDDLLINSSVASKVSGFLLGHDDITVGRTLCKLGFCRISSGEYVSDEIYKATYHCTLTCYEMPRGARFRPHWYRGPYSEAREAYVKYDYSQLIEMETYLRNTLIPALKKLPEPKSKSKESKEVDDLKEQVAELQQKLDKMMSKDQDSSSYKPSYW